MRVPTIFPNAFLMYREKKKKQVDRNKTIHRFKQKTLGIFHMRFKYMRASVQMQV